MSDIIKELEKEQLRTDLPELEIGDQVRVYVKVVEGTHERLQNFEESLAWLRKKRRRFNVLFLTIYPVLQIAFLIADMIISQTLYTTSLNAYIIIFVICIITIIATNINYSRKIADEKKQLERKPELLNEKYSISQQILAANRTFEQTQKQLNSNFEAQQHALAYQAAALSYQLKT